MRIIANTVIIIDQEKLFGANDMVCLMDEIKITNCPYCKSTRVYKHTISDKEKLRFKCYSCNHTFTPNRSNRGKKRIEDIHCAALWEWAQFNPVTRDYLIRVENGRFRFIKEAAQLKAEGLRKGVHDYFLAYAVKSYHGLWVEMKPPKEYKSKISKEQMDWLEKMRAGNYAAYIAHGWVEASEIIMRYLNSK